MTYEQLVYRERELRKLVDETRNPQLWLMWMDALDAVIEAERRQDSDSAAVTHDSGKTAASYES